MSQNDRLRELLERFQRGDNEAAEIIYREFTEIVENVLKRKLQGTGLGRTVRVSDIVQSGMAKIWEYLDHLIANVENIPGYLTQIAKYKLATKLREKTTGKRAIDKEVYDEQVLAEVADVESASLEKTAVMEQYEIVMACLSDTDRLLLEARFAENSWDEVSKIVGLPSADAARQKATRVIERLREEFFDELGN